MTKKESQFIDDMKRYRGIDFARIGMMVEVYGDVGTIVGMNSSANLTLFLPISRSMESTNTIATQHAASDISMMKAKLSLNFSE